MMERAEVKLAELNHDRDGMVCPTCGYVQYLIHRDMEPGTYKCGDCYELFEIEQSLLDNFRVNGTKDEVEDRFDGLERRLERLERELGIK
jgi:DNA-directed RNA polymerase subunit RPC12/RpoP